MLACLHHSCFLFLCLELALGLLNCATVTLRKTMVGDQGTNKNDRTVRFEPAAPLHLKWLLQRWRPGLQLLAVSCHLQSNAVKLQRARVSTPETSV